MILSLLASAIMVFGATLGLAWPIAARLRLAPAEKLVASAMLSLVLVFLWAFTRYIAGLPVEALWLIPVIAAFSLVRCRRSIAEMFADPAARELGVAQALVSVWCLGLVALIASYSGGGWIGDWFGHWQRMQFFVEHWPRDTLFNGFDPVTSRPPLVNVVTGVFVIPGPAAFAGYQVVTTLLSSLAFLPAALLAHRFGGPMAIRVLAVLAMLSPFLVQNATFAWTKLPTAFFVLTGLIFFLRTTASGAPLSAALLCGLALGAAVLAHYSAAPYVIVLGIAWCLIGTRHGRDSSWWRTTGAAVLAGGLLLATWFGWSLATYGFRGTFLTNTTVTDQARTFADQAAVMALNLRDTLVPHFLRTVDYSMFAQPSTSGWWRDWFFLLYQVNLPFAFGSASVFAIGYCAVRRARDAAPYPRAFWFGCMLSITVLGVVVHSGRDPWGLAHICLQPLVLAGLAFLAAGWSSLGRGWRLCVTAGISADFMLGIVLHFGVQSGAIDRWLAPSAGLLDTLFRYSEFARMNLRAKLQNQWLFVADVLGPYATLVPLALAAVLAVALYRASRQLGSATASVGQAPGQLSSALSGRLALTIAAVGAVACLWVAWCEFPRYIWNELRVAPAFALRHGVNPYPPTGGGPLSTWIYGPVGMILNLPATWAASAQGAVQLASLINALVVLLPVALVFFASAELRARPPAVRWFAMALAIVVIPRHTLTLQVADHAAIAFGIVAAWWLARDAQPSARCIATAAAACTAAVWSKQVAVFLVPAHLAFLLLAGQRRASGYYILWLAACNALAAGAAVLAFGLGNLWLNLVEIPGKLPWAEDLGGRLQMHAADLAWHVVVPAAAMVGLWAAGRWPGRERQSGRFWQLAVLTFWAVLPVGVASLLKYGGNINVLHSSAYLLPAALLLWLARDVAAPFAPARLLAVAVFAIALRWPDVTAFPRGPETDHYQRAAELAALRPQGTWFPNNPLVTFYADGRLWHTHDGIVTRDLAGLGLREADFKRHIPSDLHFIVYPRGVVFPVALQLLPEFNQTLTEKHWAIHRRTPSRTSAP